MDAMKITLPALPDSPVVRVLSGFALIVIVLVAAAWFWAPPERSVPDALVGEWVSSDTHYDDRVFEIDRISVNFGTPGAKVTVGFIQSVTAEPDGPKTLYTISYVANKLPGQISFYYDTQHGETIYFKNRKTVYWTKRPKI
jgi:hypothetical protein